jgi:hypothetical protein
MKKSMVPLKKVFSGATASRMSDFIGRLGHVKIPRKREQKH